MFGNPSQVVRGDRVTHLVYAAEKAWPAIPATRVLEQTVDPHFAAIMNVLQICSSPASSIMQTVHLERSIKIAR